MDSHLIWFVFHLVAHYYELHGGSDYTWHDAIVIATGDMNKVIGRHNECVIARRGEQYKYHDTSDYTDNQCVFSSLLEHDKTYKRIETHRWIDIKLGNIA